MLKRRKIFIRNCLIENVFEPKARKQLNKIYSLVNKRAKIHLDGLRYNVPRWIVKYVEEDTLILEDRDNHFRIDMKRGICTYFLYGNGTLEKGYFNYIGEKHLHTYE